MMLYNVVCESYFHLRLLHTSIIDIQKRVLDNGMLYQGHMFALLYHYTGQVGPRFGDSGSLEATGCDPS
jgi:hypothetical protein